MNEQKPELSYGRKHVLSTAEAAVLGQRDQTYGGPEQNFERIAALFNAYLGGRGFLNNPSGEIIRPTDVAILLALVKIGRLIKSPDHFDSWVDIAGYAACGSECSVKQKGTVFETPNRTA